MSVFSIDLEELVVLLGFLGLPTRIEGLLIKVPHFRVLVFGVSGCFEKLKVSTQGFRDVFSAVWV